MSCNQEIPIMTRTVFVYVTEKDKHWIVKECPFCGASDENAHRHGAEVLGYRTAHCVNMRNGNDLYYLTTDEYLNHAVFYYPIKPWNTNRE